MSFLSVHYLVFLLLLFVVYFIVEKISRNIQWIILLLASYVFYGFYSVKYMIFLLFSTLVTWGVAIGINECNLQEKIEIMQDSSITREKKKRIKTIYERKRKLWISLAVTLNIGLLVIMKYANFGLASLNTIMGTNFRMLQWVVLPLGFSFYTFQSLGYCIDVYRGAVEAQHNLFKYALFVSFFPQLCEGPIGNYEELMPQLLERHPFDYDSFVKGLIRILIGFFKKIVVADRLALFVNPIYSNYNEHSGSIILFATVLYSFQLYADFSGYIDIALGTAKCLGIHLTENFSASYFSCSITEFWRRWHISLGVWFRNYLYYPVQRSDLVLKLGKNLSKNGKMKISSSLIVTIGLVVTWTLIGMWHGAGYKYLVYGWYHGFFIIIAVWFNEFYKKAKVICHIKDNFIWKLFQIVRTFSIVTLGYVIFRAKYLKDAFAIYRRILTAFYYHGGQYKGILIFSRGEWIFLVFSILICFMFDIIECKKKLVDWIYERNIIIRWSLLYILLFITLMFFLQRPADSGNFIYFEF
ncbi:MAG: hypothetical protein K5986_04535 [Clostridium sp.]|nr:hypothetical protein [Clostridium sp.]